MHTNNGDVHVVDRRSQHSGGGLLHTTISCPIDNVKGGDIDRDVTSFRISDDVGSVAPSCVNELVALFGPMTSFRTHLFRTPFQLTRSA
jgi:hypothetical protein